MFIRLSEGSNTVALGISFGRTLAGSKKILLWSHENQEIHCTLKRHDSEIEIAFLVRAVPSPLYKEKTICIVELDESFIFS